MITISNLTYTYPNDTKIPAVNDLSLTIPNGQWIAICGHNGSGKSTLAKLIDGLLEADSGSVIVENIPLTAETIYDVRAKIGMVFQNPDNQFVGVTVADDVAFGLENQGVEPNSMQPRIDEALALVGMSEYAHKEPSRLSGGQKQRVAIASVLAQQPKIIILDEATAMLDPQGRQQVLDVVQQLQKRLNLIVISITHDIEEVMLADRVIVLQSGKLIYDNTPQELFHSTTNITQLGLALPYEKQVYEHLKQKGVVLPQEYMTQEVLENWICQSLLTK